MYPPSENQRDNRPIVLVLDFPKTQGASSGHYKSVEVTDDCILPPLANIMSPGYEQWEALFSDRLRAYSQIAPEADSKSKNKKEGESIYNCVFINKLFRRTNYGSWNLIN